MKKRHEEVINEKDRCKTCVGKKTVKKQFEGMQIRQKITFHGESNQDACDKR